MAKAIRVQQVGARRVLTVLVGEDAVQHEDLLAVGMLVGRKAAARIVAHEARHPAALGAAAELQALAPYTRSGARLPRHGAGIDDHSLGEIFVELLWRAHPLASRCKRLTVPRVSDARLSITRPMIAFTRAASFQRVTMTRSSSGSTHTVLCPAPMAKKLVPGARS